jgi:hypothetical protein
VQGFPGGRTFDNRIERDGEGRGGHFCRRTVNTTFTLRAKARLRLMEVTCHHNNVPGLILAARLRRAAKVKPTPLGAAMPIV